jgi:hypothetical protein
MLQEITNIVDNYLIKISEKYNIDIGELRECVDSKLSGEKKASKNESESEKESMIDMNDISVERLSKCTKPELMALCKACVLKTGGKKEELMERLMEFSKNKSEGKKESPKVVPKKQKNDMTDVVKKIVESNVEKIAIRRNTFGNFEIPSLGFVINKNTQHVYGKQLPDGKVADLTEEDIEECHRRNIEVEMPRDLGVGKNNENNKVLDDLESDSDEDIEESESDEDIEED